MQKSAGILIFRRRRDNLEFFLVHPGGPFWKNKDLGAWSIPKGEFSADEDALDAAKREFREETGVECMGEFIPLNPVKLKSGKLVLAWGVEMDLDETAIVSNEFEIEWPPRSGKMKSFPEIDRGGWFTALEVSQKINPAQSPLVEELNQFLRKQ